MGLDHGFEVLFRNGISNQIDHLRHRAEFLSITCPHISQVSWLGKADCLRKA